MMQKSKGFKWLLIIVVVAAMGIYFLPKIGSPKEVSGDEIEVKSGDISTYYSFSGSIRCV